jgi:hypothetical protein
MRWQASLLLPTIQKVHQLRLDDRSRWPQFCRLGNEVVQALMKGQHAAFITVPTHAVTHDGNLAVVLAVQRRIASQGTEDRVNAIEEHD